MTTTTNTSMAVIAIVAATVAGSAIMLLSIAQQEASAQVTPPNCEPAGKSGVAQKCSFELGPFDVKCSGVRGTYNCHVNNL